MTSYMVPPISEPQEPGSPLTMSPAIIYSQMRCHSLNRLRNSWNPRLRSERSVTSTSSVNYIVQPSLSKNPNDLVALEGTNNVRFPGNIQPGPRDQNWCSFMCCCMEEGWCNQPDKNKMVPTSLLDYQSTIIERFTICSMMYTTSFMAKRSMIYCKTSSQTNFMIKTVVSCRSFGISLAQSIETSSGEASHSWNRSRRAERRLAQLRHWNPQCSMEYLPTSTPKKQTKSRWIFHTWSIYGGYGIELRTSLEISSFNLLKLRFHHTDLSKKAKIGGWREHDDKPVASWFWSYLSPFVWSNLWVHLSVLESRLEHPKTDHPAVN